MNGLLLVATALILAVPISSILGGPPSSVGNAATAAIRTGAIHIDGVDAHDGDLKQFDGVYYLYGTSYGCGFQWSVDSPYCGVRIYASSDLSHWKPLGYAFDATTTFWQLWCGSKAFPDTGGCYEPRVVAIDGGYTMWLDVARKDRVAVLHSVSPAGPFEFRSWSTIHGGWSEAVYYDRLGEGDLWYAVTTHTMDITLQSRNGSYTIRSGSVGRPGIESPGLFRTDLEWVLTVSYGPCGFCDANPTAYFTSTDPLVSWQFGGVISQYSCDGQANGVVVLNGQPYEWLDLWDGHQNQSQTKAPIVLAPLLFNQDGALQPLIC